MSSQQIFRPQPPSFPATLLANTTAEQVVLNPATGTPLLIPIPSNSAIEGKVSGFEMAGEIVAGAAGNVTAKLYNGVSATVGSDTLIASSGAKAHTQRACAFVLRGQNMVLDPLSGTLVGTLTGMIDGATFTAVDFTVLTGLTESAIGAAILNLLVSFTVSVANANNKVVVTDFGVIF